jgi:hypothetical protein
VLNDNDVLVESDVLVDVESEPDVLNDSESLIEVESLECKYIDITKHVGVDVIINIRQYK